MAVPDIPLLASDMKARIIPWSHTNLGIVSEFYQDGQWHIGDENTAWYLSPCFAALAATMYRWDTTLTAYKQIAIDTVEAGFKWNLKPVFYSAPRYVYNANPTYPLLTGLPAVSRRMTNMDGGPWGTPDPYGDGDESSTMEAGSTFCWILDMLYSSGGIDQNTARRWLANLKLCCDWLIDYNGNPIWYTNGNYVAHQMLLYTHVAKICRTLGDEAGWARYTQAYEMTYLTLVNPFGNNPPANAQWANYGYTVDVVGAQSTGTGTGTAAVLLPSGCVSDGSSETGHLTETSGHITITPGVTNTFDGVYSQLQMDLLATIYTVNRDWRINYLLNAIWNKLETITNFSTYLIDCTGGSRQTGVRGWTGGYQNTIAMLCRRTNNRTQLTNAHCTGAWDNQMAANLTANGNNAINQIQSSTTRQYRIAIATTLHACYLVAPKLS